MIRVLARGGRKKSNTARYPASSGCSKARSSTRGSTLSRAGMADEARERGKGEQVGCVRIQAEGKRGPEVVRAGRQTFLQKEGGSSVSSGQKPKAEGRATRHTSRKRGRRELE